MARFPDRLVGRRARSGLPVSENKRPGRHRCPQAEAQACPPDAHGDRALAVIPWPLRSVGGGAPEMPLQSLPVSRAQGGGIFPQKGMASGAEVFRPGRAFRGMMAPPGAWGCRSGPWKTPKSNSFLAPIGSRVRDASSMGRFRKGG